MVVLAAAVDWTSVHRLPQDQADSGLQDRATTVVLVVADNPLEVAAVLVPQEALASLLPEETEAQDWLHQFQAAASITPEVAAEVEIQHVEQEDLAVVEMENRILLRFHRLPET